MPHERVRSTGWSSGKSRSRRPPHRRSRFRCKEPAYPARSNDRGNCRNPPTLHSRGFFLPLPPTIRLRPLSQLPCMARFRGTHNSARHRPTIDPSNELTRGSFAHLKRDNNMSLASPRLDCWIILRGPCWYPRALLGGDCDDTIVEFPISCGQQRWALEPRDTRRAEGARGRKTKSSSLFTSCEHQ